MQSFLILVLSVLSFGTFQNDKDQNQKEAENMTTYFFIRHAEKDLGNSEEKDPDLSEEGQKRASRWAEILKENPLDLVYSSDYKRTQQTAAPIAHLHGLTVQSYDPRKPYDEEFRENTRGKRVLIVGHSNTNPNFVNAILGEQKFSDLAESEYGSLFVVNVSPDGTKSCQVLYIN